MSAPLPPTPTAAALAESRPQAPPGARREVAWVLAVVALSLVVRLVLLTWIVRHDVPTIFDEGTYFTRARGFTGIFRAWLHGHAPAGSLWTIAYDRGIWPPFHKAVLGLAFLVFGVSLPVARAVGVVISTLTTFGIYRLGRRLELGRGALAGALVHALHPSFVLFACLAYSETLFVALLVAATLAALKFPLAASARRAALSAAAAGAFVGCAVLTRTAGLVLIAALPVALFVLERRRRRALAGGALALAVALTTIAPWLVWLHHREHRFVLLSTRTAYYFYFGNLGMEGDSQRYVDRVLKRAQREQNVDPETTARREALKIIRGDPAGFAARSVLRVGSLFAPDVYIWRHVLGCVLPPVAPNWAALAVAVALATPALVLAAAARGVAALKRPGRRELGFALVVASVMLSPALTISNSRIALPIAALLLPLAGYGAVAPLPQSRRGVRRTAWLAVALLALVNGVTISHLTRDKIQASSWYGRLTSRLGHRLATTAVTLDCVALSARGDAVGRALGIRLLAPEYSIRGAGTNLEWNPQAGSSTVRFLVEGRASPQPVELAVDGLGDPVHVTPIRPASWRRWQSAEDPRIRVQWCGGGEPVGRMRSPSGLRLRPGRVPGAPARSDAPPPGPVDSKSAGMAVGARR